MTRDKITYTHGDSGSQPADGNEFASNERPDAQHFDWFWNRVVTVINKLWDEFTRLDNDDDGVVDGADTLGATAQLAPADVMEVATYDADGDNVVDVSDQTKRAEVRTSDVSSPSDGRMWIRSDL